MSKPALISQILLLIAVLFVLLIAGCAAVHHEEQEGGITGTGHDSIDCTDENNRKHKLCVGNTHRGDSDN